MSPVASARGRLRGSDRCCLALSRLPPQISRKEGFIHFRKVSPDNIRDLFVDEIRAYNPHIPDNWKELAAAGLYEWRALMESAGAAGAGAYSPDGTDGYGVAPAGSGSGGPATG